MKNDVEISRILANETRMKILDLLGKNNKMSCGSLREMLGGINTGKLNYHLSP